MSGNNRADKCVNCANWDTTAFEDGQGRKGRCEVLEQKLKVSISSSETVENTAKMDFIFTPPGYGCNEFIPAMDPVTLPELLYYRDYLSGISKGFYLASKKSEDEDVKAGYYEAMDEISKLKEIMENKIY